MKPFIVGVLMAVSLLEISCVMKESIQVSPESAISTPATNAIENGLLLLPEILSTHHTQIIEPNVIGGNYFLVNPATVNPNLFIEKKLDVDPQLGEQVLREATQKLSTPEYDAIYLLEQLIMFNQSPIELRFPSDPSRGYVIDDNDTFRNFAKENKESYAGRIWQKFYEAYPDVVGILEASLPAIDKENGYALAYVKYSWGFMAMRSWLILYKIDGDKITEVKREILWMT
jgi:hypothetical protein